jgi:hypothetical protein
MPLTIEFTGPKNRRRRLSFTDRGERLGYWREEEVYRDGEWDPAGREVVTDVAIEADQDIASAVADGGPVVEVPGP